MWLTDAVGAGWTAVRRSRRLLGLVALMDALIALPPALYIGVVMDRAAGGRVDANELALHLDPDLTTDLARRIAPAFDEVMGLLVAGSLLVFFLVRPLVLGGYAGIAAAPRRLRFDAFVREGGALYWKFLRLSVLAVIALYLLSLAARPLLDSIDEQALLHQREDISVEWRRITELVVFVGFLATSTILDYARIGIQRHRRPGVLAELIRSALFVLQHPLRTLGFNLVAFFIEVAIIWIAIPVLRWADGAYLVTSVVVFVLLQLVMVAREGTRLFHLGGAQQIREVEEPVLRGGAAGDDSGRERDLLDNLPWNVV
jgi:hypothetical protein